MSGVYAGQQQLCSAPGAISPSHISHVLGHCNHLVNGFWNVVLTWSKNFYDTSPPRILFSARQTTLLRNSRHGNAGLVSEPHYTSAHHTLRQGCYFKPHAIVMMVGIWSDYCMSSLQHWYVRCPYQALVRAPAEMTSPMPFGLRCSTPDVSADWHMLI
jgi:hypothetical protein